MVLPTNVHVYTALSYMATRRKGPSAPALRDVRCVRPEVVLEREYRIGSSSCRSWAEEVASDGNLPQILQTTGGSYSNKMLLS